MSVRAADAGVQPAAGLESAPAQNGADRQTARRVTAIVGVLALAVFMSSLDLFIVNLAFPYIGSEYHGTSLGSLSWVLNAYTIVFAAELVAARIVQAAGAGLMVPASLSLLLASVPAAGRAKAIGTWSAFGALGAALGPVIGGS